VSNVFYGLINPHVARHRNDFGIRIMLLESTITNSKETIHNIISVEFFIEPTEVIKKIIENKTTSAY